MGVEVFSQCTEGCGCFVDAVVDVSVRCQRVVDDGAQVLEIVGERHEAVSNIEVGDVAAVQCFAWCWAKHGFRFRCSCTSSDVHEQPEAPQVAVEMIRASNEISSSVKDECAVVCKE